MKHTLFLTILSTLALSYTGATVWDFKEQGGIPNASDRDSFERNTALLTSLFNKTAPGDTLVIPFGNFYFAGGVSGSNLYNFTWIIQGKMIFDNDQFIWPRDSNGHVFECIHLAEVHGLTIKSVLPGNMTGSLSQFNQSNWLHDQGTIDGQGAGWWGYIEYVLIGENRPRLLNIEGGTDILIEGVLLKNSPYWTTWIHDVSDLEIRYSSIQVHRDNASDHNYYDMGAFNTDGFDIAGRNIWVHDCSVWNDDDCFCVKGSSPTGKYAQCSENYLFERISASGVGLTIGSIGAREGAPECVRNITFKDAVMPNTFKGIYIKSRPSEGSGFIKDILYQNITINNPNQWAIWIGPQQASYGGACSLLWPFIPGTECPVPAALTFSNITLRDITINNPQTSPGVIIGNETNPMTDIIFDNVVVNNPGKLPWGDKFYACTNVKNGQAVNGTSPVPPCFNQITVNYD